MQQSERGPRVAPKLKPAIKENDIGRVWHAIEHERESKRKPFALRGRALRLGGVGLACALALLAFYFTRPSEGPLALENEQALPAELGSDERASTRYRLDDGSEIVLAPFARAEVLRNDSGELVTLLRRGKSTFDVRPGGKRRWSIEAGALTVQVLGTRFVVERNQRGVSVSVQRGVVLVQGDSVPDRVKRLSAGQSLTVATTLAEARPTERAPETRPEAKSEEPDPQPEAKPTAVADPPRAQDVRKPPQHLEVEATWWELAEQGAYVDAVRAVARLGGVAAVRPTIHEPRLVLALADVARESGQTQLAAAVLEELLTAHPRAQEAALAAFTLGKLELDVLGRAAAAATHFAFVLEHKGGRALVEDALARSVEAHARAGDLAAARAFRERYEARFPQGRYREAVQRWAGSKP